MKKLLILLGCMACTPLEAHSSLWKHFDKNAPFNDFFLNVLGTDLETYFKQNIDVHYSEKDIRIEIEVPGFGSKDITVECEDGCLIVTTEHYSEKKKETKEGEEKSTKARTFQRTIKIPNGVDESNIKASVENGLLTIVLPQKEKREEKRSIPVTEKVEQHEQVPTSK